MAKAVAYVKRAIAAFPEASSLKVFERELRKYAG